MEYLQKIRNLMKNTEICVALNNKTNIHFVLHSSAWIGVLLNLYPIHYLFKCITFVFFICVGTTFLQQFCASAVNAVVSPFILYDLAMEAARFLARNNPTHVPTQLRSNLLNSLFQKCLQM